MKTVTISQWIGDDRSVLYCLETKQQLRKWEIAHLVPLKEPLDASVIFTKAIQTSFSELISGIIQQMVEKAKVEKGK